MTYQVKYAKINLTGFLRFKNSFLWNVWMDGGWSRQPLVHSLDTLFDRSDKQDKFCYQKISGLNVQRSIIARNYILFTTQFSDKRSHTLKAQTEILLHAEDVKFFQSLDGSRE